MVSFAYICACALNYVVHWLATRGTSMAEKSVQEVLSGAFSKVISALQRPFSVRSRPPLGNTETSLPRGRLNARSPESDSDEASQRPAGKKR